MPIFESEDGEVFWLEESATKPKDMRLWNRAKQVALLDKDYSPYTAKLISRRIYAMLGGSYAPKKSPKEKGKVRFIKPMKISRPKKSTVKKGK